MSVYSKWSVIKHLAILAAESITLSNTQQSLIYYLPNVFWIRVFIVSLFGLLATSHFFIGVFDLIFNYGLLMRFVADLPMSYYLVKPPKMFDDTLPNEGQEYKESMGKAFIKHCWEAQKTQGKIVFSYIGFILVLIFLRAVYVIFKSYFFRPKKTYMKGSVLSQNTKNVITMFTIGVFISYLFSFNGDKMDEYVPSHWYFYRTSIKHQMPLKQYQETVQNLRAKFQLPPGEDWIDQRSVPVYPLVHGPKEFALAYNNKTKANVKHQEPQYEMPNVVILLWESLTPAPKYLLDDVILNEQTIRDGQPFRHFYLPKLAELAEQGHTFFGVRSNGIPTINGWHSFTTGEISNSHGVNMIASYHNDMDDIPSKFKDLGYYNLVLWPCGFQSDKNQNYVFRGKQVVDGPDFIKQFPMWFDEIHNFYPTKEEADMMEIEDYPKEQKYWTNDRLSSQMFNYFFNQRVTDSRKPVFGFYGNVDTHEDFSGFDDDEQYEPFNIGVGRTNLYDIYGRHDGYSTVLKYSDYQFGRIYDNIRKNANNTIVIVLGDHASRQVPLYIHPDKRINEESDIYYDMDCNYRSMGADQQFITSAVMAYFGDNPIIKKRFDAIKNKTSFEPADHQDVIVTLFDILSEAGAQRYPSSRLGQNLFTEVEKLIKGKKAQRNPKISTSHFNVEYSDNDGYFRFNLLSPKDGYEIVKPLPSCIAGKNTISTAFDKKKFKEARRMIQLTNFLNENNRVFNYKFRDTECVEQGSCQFPEPNRPFQTQVVYRFMKAILRMSAKLTVAMYILVTILQTVNFVLRKVSGLFIKTQVEQTPFKVTEAVVDLFLIKSSNCDECIF